MKRKIAVVSLLSILPAVPTHGSFYTGNELKEVCDRSKTECVSVVIGAVDMMILTHMTPDAKQYLCLPNDVSSIQITDIVLKHIEANPETRHYPAAALIWNSVTKAFPCKNAAKP